MHFGNYIAIIGFFFSECYIDQFLSYVITVSRYLFHHVI
jgi:hypothetical protein